MKEGRTDSVDNSQKSHREGDRKCKGICVSVMKW